MPAVHRRKTQPKAEPQVTPSPSREERVEARQQQWLQSLDVVDLDKHERVFLAVCQDIYRRERGTFTPFEKFIVNLVRNVRFGDPLTPQELLDSESFENFRSDYEDMKRCAPRFMEQYERDVKEAA